MPTVFSVKILSAAKKGKMMVTGTNLVRLKNTHIAVIFFEAEKNLTFFGQLVEFVRSIINNNKHPRSSTRTIFVAFCLCGFKLRTEPKCTAGTLSGFRNPPSCNYFGPKSAAGSIKSGQVPAEMAKMAAAPPGVLRPFRSPCLELSSPESQDFNT